MSKGNTQELFNLIKTIVDNYMRARKPAAVVLGTYNGSVIQVGNIPVPMGKIQGNMTARLSPGDTVRLLRNDGGGDYIILEIVGKPYMTGGV